MNYLVSFNSNFNVNHSKTPLKHLEPHETFIVPIKLYAYDRKFSSDLCNNPKTS